MSLVILTVLTGTVMIAIGNNIALSVGTCCGVGSFFVAAIGSGAVFAGLLRFGAVKNDSRVLVIIRGPGGLRAWWSLWYSRHLTAGPGCG